MSSPAVPQPPTPRFLYRKLQAGLPDLTILRWDTVLVDVNGNPTKPNYYNIYRSTSPNLETMALVATVSTVDINGAVDTCWSEDYSGFLQYGITAVNNVGEGPMATIVVVSQNQLESI
jgi:fibronectin type 3 domain-containing protein